MAAYVELNIDQGATFNNIITLTDDITSANMNLAGYSVSSRIKSSYYSSTIKANIVCTITDSANGQISMGLSAANTANLRAGRYVFDVKLTDSGGVASRVLEGLVFVNPGVT